jgi:hypothetical protein
MAEMSVTVNFQGLGTSQEQAKLMTAIGLYMKSKAQQCIINEKDPDGNNWEPWTISRRLGGYSTWRKRDDPAAKLLRDTAILLGSISWIAYDSTVEIWEQMLAEHWIYHQFPTYLSTFQPTKPWRDIDPSRVWHRPFLGLSGDMMDEIDKMIDNFVTNKIAQSLGTSSGGGPESYSVPDLDLDDPGHPFEDLLDQILRFIKDINIFLRG